jgi:hypothetical protein
MALDVTLPQRRPASQVPLMPVPQQRWPALPQAAPGRAVEGARGP